jgi:TAT (twin-arginine translocation) pathway signal sequence
MERRQFLQSTVLGAAATMLGAAPSPQPQLTFLF